MCASESSQDSPRLAQSTLWRICEWYHLDSGRAASALQPNKHILHNQKPMIKQTSNDEGTV
jgi:hypothetical protein